MTEPTIIPVLLDWGNGDGVLAFVLGCVVIVDVGIDDDIERTSSKGSKDVVQIYS